MNHLYELILLLKHAYPSKGPIDTAYSFSKAVEYSSFLIMCHHTIVVPAKPRDNFWSFLHPLTYQVWIGILISVPLFSLAMALTNRIFYKHMDWENVIAFVLRVANHKVYDSDVIHQISPQGLPLYPNPL